MKTIGKFSSKRPRGNAFASLGQSHTHICQIVCSVSLTKGGQGGGWQEGRGDEGEKGRAGEGVGVGRGSGKGRNWLRNLGLWTAASHPSRRAPDEATQPSNILRKTGKPQKSDQKQHE